MIDKHILEVGRVVHLRPYTKQAPRECYLRLAAEVLSTDRWPIVRVRVSADPVVDIDVHIHNVGLHPVGRTTGRSNDGDGANRAQTPTRFQPAFRPHRPLADGDYEEPMLF